MEPIVNRVAQSDIVVYNLEALWDERPIVELDLAPFLEEGLILREKPFRQQVQAHDWSQYADQHVAIYCSTDAIVPIWAYMLVATKLHGIARSVAFGRREDLLRNYFVRALEREDWSKYRDRIVVVKGCASKIVPVDAYVQAVLRLQEVARKVMYGEPCSSVPLWRRPEARPTPQAQAVRPAFPERSE
ncbi:DUF2480 family protein [Rhodothermus marinus]|uniref:DUF2480 family protein n=1 Tax=Rhodothermus marinus TaxID=29549 RepID=UPI000223DB8E|nr:DUF2480 family protein [Rhodothermus marinus]AEN74068.1 Protein of unknown function DUF2480 [Rhodothermus marinus SG0.5JP17-172]MBO2490957.1 DUF2480 family protein [Rhodothermus marinus]BBM68900.1 hypothetical protein RmaAA213_07460 [Rhodothermus marinus]BBM71878.1 hypothetical protein RmaAA338_07430 [Rhodothermus marinus]